MENKVTGDKRAFLPFLKMRKLLILPYFFILVATTLIFFYIARSQGSNFNFPLSYYGDAIEALADTAEICDAF